jgi:hypothetical protein
MMIKVLACSERVIEKVLGQPQRGLVQSAFSAAANVSFAAGFMLSLNASPHPLLDKGMSLMPNGVLLSARAAEWPFGALKAGMPVVLGVGWLVFEAISCSLDCTGCVRWNPHIEHPAIVDDELLKANARWLAQFCQLHGSQMGGERLEYGDDETILALAARLCGRGPGLTPSGDDFLAGWMAVGWLLYGPQPTFLAHCQRITEIASQSTHALSQCWLAYAAAGDVARPIGELLAALTVRNPERLECAARHVLALGATSGHDLLQGILYGLKFPLVLCD